MTILIHIGNQPLVSSLCSSHYRSVHGSLLLPLQPWGPLLPPSMSSNPLVAEGMLHLRVRSFASGRPSLFPVRLIVLSRLGSHYHHTFCAQQLQQ